MGRQHDTGLSNCMEVEPQSDHQADPQSNPQADPQGEPQRNPLQLGVKHGGWGVVGWDAHR